MRLTRPTCATCVYWVADPTQGGGHCHSHPPGIHTNAATGTVVQKFPMTDPRQWCGEWSDDEVGMADMARRAVARAASRGQRIEPLPTSPALPDHLI